MAAVRIVTLIRFIVIREIILVYMPTFSRLLNTLEQLLMRLDGYIIVKFKVKGVQVLGTTPNFIFFKIIILEYTISSTDSLKDLVNSNYNHVHAIIVEFCEPLGLN